MAATNINEGYNSLFFTLGWKERKAIRSVIKHGTHLQVREEKKLLSSRFYVRAAGSYQREELGWLAVMIAS